MVPYAGLSFYCFEMLKYFSMKYGSKYTCKKLERNTGEKSIRKIMKVLKLLIILFNFFFRWPCLICSSKITLWWLSWSCSTIIIISIRCYKTKNAIGHDEPRDKKIWVSYLWKFKHLLKVNRICRVKVLGGGVNKVEVKQIKLYFLFVCFWFPLQSFCVNIYFNLCDAYLTFTS